jgi:hypothetical protein
VRHSNQLLHSLASPPRPDPVPHWSARSQWGSLCLSSLLVAGVCTLLFACRADSVATAPPASANLYFALQLDQHAINMSLSPPSNTIQLSATALNQDGQPLADTGTVRFSASDSTVTVSPAGLVTAQYTNQSGVTLVIASLQKNNVTLADTAFIHVTASPPAAALATFSIQPLPGDSAIVGYPGSYTVTVHATDANGQAMLFDPQDNFVYFSSSNPALVAVDRSAGQTSSGDTAHVTLVATTWAYGIAKRDSVHFLEGWPISAFVLLDSVVDLGAHFLPPSVVLGVGGVVQFVRGIAKRGDQFGSVGNDVVFDNPAAVDSASNFCGNFTGRGNISPIDTVNACKWPARSFPVAGTYNFQSVLFPPASGVIRVLQNHPL